MSHLLQLRLLVAAVCLLAVTACAPADSKTTESLPPDTALASSAVAALPAPMARTYIVSPVDGAEVLSTFKVVFGLDGMGVAPAGTVKEGTGHHHLLIDVDTLPDLSRPLPVTDQVVHFGGGQTEAQVTLAPGQHTLQLLLGDFAHIPHSKPVLSPKITITVVE